MNVTRILYCKQASYKIQQEAESLFKRQSPDQGGILEAIQPEPIASMLITPNQSNGQANHDCQAMQPEESLNF